MVSCANCNNQVTGNFCSHCGLAVTTERINKRFILHEIFHQFHFERGFFYTVKNLLIKPGESVKEYINTNRQKHMNPITFIILTSLIFTLLANYFHVNELLASSQGKEIQKSKITEIFNWTQSNYGYSNILMSVFIALTTRMFFRKYQYNYYEIMVLLCFVMGQGMFLLVIETLFVNMMNAKTYINILTLVSLAYPAWAIGQFFDKRKFGSYVKAILAYALGSLLFYLVVIFVGLMADFIIN